MQISLFQICIRDMSFSYKIEILAMIDKFVSFFPIGSLFMGGFTSFSVIINSNLSLIGRKH